MRSPSRWLTLFSVLLVAAACIPHTVYGQYFGRNKVQYEDFDFKELETEHFIFHYYSSEEQAVRDAARMAERWYERHSQVLNHRFDEKKPIILYANDADFQQTNVTEQRISPGTGGFTEPRRERVVMPLSPTYAETSHVLGHELVHSFQFDIALNSDGPPLNLNQIPLWMTEGMAEYLSIGRADSHTAMWMRDAAVNGDMPTFDELRNYGEYFPYRYGQAHLAYVAGKYGDRAVSNLYRLTGRIGADSAYVRLFGISADSLAREWGEATREAYAPLLSDRTPADSAGTKVLAEDIDAGTTNIAPVLSPDGRYVAFISSRDVFSFNLFVADAETGEVIADLESPGTTAHFNALRFINSAGTWSPDGTRLAFVSYSDGDNQLTVWNVESEEIETSYKVEGVTSMKNPAWSPDGSRLAFTGTDGGISDLYVLNLQTEKVRQLTNDRYADLQPTWAPDGETIAFTTDRGQTDLGLLAVSKKMSLARIDVQSADVTIERPFPDALHHNPQYSPDGQSLYFVSDQDGFKDVYRMNLDSGELYRVTHLQTGVSGITGLSPAMSVAGQSGDLMMSVYNDDKYTGYRLAADEAQGQPLASTTTAAAPTVPSAPDATPAAPDAPVADTTIADTTITDTTGTDTTGTDTTATDTATARPDTTTTVAEAAPGELVTTGGGVHPKAGVLPPFSPKGEGIVATYLDDPRMGLPPPERDFETEDYDAGLSLEAVAPPRVGATVGGPFGGGVSGGVALVFGDMLGNHRLTTFLQARGTFRDIGGGVSYLNQKNQLNWGGSVGHRPIIYGVRRLGNYQVVRRLQLSQAGVDVAYPIGPTQRFEFGLGATRYGFGVNVREFGNVPDLSFEQLNDLLLEEEGVRLPPELETRYYGSASLAYVRDFSVAALTSPIKGGRLRVQVTPRLGTDSYVNVLGDFRRYFYAKPFTFALQALHVGNYGAEASFDQRFGFGDEYLGYPYGQGFVRGYNLRDIDVERECPDDAQPLQNQVAASCPEIDRLLGTRTATLRAEIRIPLLGPEQISLIPFRYLPTEIAFFADAGVAWTAENAPSFDFDRTEAPNIPVTSTGVAARFNVLGRVIVEGYYAIPHQRPEQSGEWGLRLLPGW